MKYINILLYVVLSAFFILNVVLGNYAVGVLVLTVATMGAILDNGAQKLKKRIRDLEYKGRMYSDYIDEILEIAATYSTFGDRYTLLLRDKVNKEFGTEDEFMSEVDGILTNSYKYYYDTQNIIVIKYLGRIKQKNLIARLMTKLSHVDNEKEKNAIKEEIKEIKAIDIVELGKKELKWKADLES
jgi:hypothetical protein